jgi:hypothetical protein
MLAALNHPKIAGIYGLERADGQTAVVMVDHLDQSAAFLECAREQGGRT